jgi:cysteine desulfurase
MAARHLNRPIYLDNHATTQTDQRVLDSMLPFFAEKFGNPHSRDHAYGWEASDAVEKARGQVAALIGAEPNEIIYTSGATESNNLAIQGVARFFKGRKNHIVTLATEHKCVLESCRFLEGEGFKVTYLPVGSTGRLDVDALDAAITGETALVSVMAAHNEIGVIPPMSEIGEVCRAHKVYFHTDAAQATGKIPLDVDDMKIDLLSISGHKLYGPMGVGALYVRRRPRVRLAPLFMGGGQERGLRSGTLPAPLCVGIGVACAVAGQEMPVEMERLRTLRDRLLGDIAARLDGVHVNGDIQGRLPGNLNISFEGTDAGGVMGALPDLALSSGSACISASIEPSYVLRAMGLADDRAAASIRIGLGRFNTDADIEHATGRIIEAVTGLRKNASGVKIEAASSTTAA